MKQILLGILFVMIILYSPVVSFGEETEVKEKVYNILKCPAIVGKISLGRVSCKAASCQKPQTPFTGALQQIMAISGKPSFEGIGDGIGDMLLSALKQTNCFEVMEREAMEELKREFELMGKTFKIEASDFLISGSINSIGMETTNTNVGLGFIPILSALDVKKTTANIGMDIRLIDVKSAKILISTTYEADNTKTGLGIGAVAWGSGFGFGGAFSSLKGTAMEEVVRDVIVKAVSDIVSAVSPKQPDGSVISKKIEQPVQQPDVKTDVKQEVHKETDTSVKN